MGKRWSGLFPFSALALRLRQSFRKRGLAAEHIGDTATVLDALSHAPEACRRLATALELEGDASEVGDFLREMAANESRRADAEMKRRWANDAAKKVAP